jgi:hypothetical protein
MSRSDEPRQEHRTAPLLPVIAPPAPAPQPARESASAPASLHIGTIEVRVSTPHPPRQVLAPPRPARRALVTRPAAGTGTIARGFGVFGLGQS